MADRNLAVDPFGIQIPKTEGMQRGNSKDNDWYTFTGITLSFKILSEKERCNY